MIDGDLVRDALDELVPPFTADGADWASIVRQAERAHTQAVASSPATPIKGTRRARLAAVPVAAAIAAVVLLVLLWPASSSPTVLDNALAAFGMNPVTHVVLQANIGSYSLDLRTGKRTTVSGREDIWYDARRGFLDKQTFNGVPSGTLFVPEKLTQPQATLPAPASQFITSSRAQFVTSYRAQLRAHAFRVTGTGQIAGIPVYWLSSPPTYIGRDPNRKKVEQVAISRATYKPVYFRTLYNNKVLSGSGQRILAVETTMSAPTTLNGSHPVSPSEWGWDIGFPTITLKQARASAPNAIIPTAIDALRLSWTGTTPFTYGTKQLRPGYFVALGNPIDALWLYYGKPYNTGLPNGEQPGFTAPYIEVFEFPHSNQITRTYAARFPEDGTVIIDGLTAIGPGRANFPLTGAHTATLKTRGSYILVQASSDQLAVAAANAMSK